MRRKDRQISHEDCLFLLDQGEFGFLATATDSGQPYGVPLSYVRLGEKIYFHCAHEGRKIDNLRQNPQATLTVVSGVKAVKEFSTLYESVLVEGPVMEITETAEKTRVLLALAEKYFPGELAAAEKTIQHFWSRTAVYALTMAQIDGKAHRPNPAKAVTE